MKFQHLAHIDIVASRRKLILGLIAKRTTGSATSFAVRGACGSSDMGRHPGTECLL
jgi:hypothetical protein